MSFLAQDLRLTLVFLLLLVLFLYLRFITKLGLPIRKYYLKNFMRLPNFLVIGAAKSGTTTLYQYLCRHPNIFMSIPKEPNFFADNKNYRMGIDWYAKLFEEAQPYQICGEASTPYTHQLHIPDIPERIYQTIPDVKLIYIMRHPVDRAYSQYVQQIKIFQSVNRKKNLKPFKVPETFEQLLERGEKVIDANDYMERIDVLAASNYINIIEKYLQFFSDKSLLFLLMDDLVKKPEETIRKACDFLQIDPDIDLLQKEAIKANTAIHHQTWYMRSRITAPLKAIPGVAYLANALPQEVRDSVYSMLGKLPYRKLIEQQYLPKPMLPETRKILLEKFQEPNRKLSEFLNRDLSHWSN